MTEITVRPARREEAESLSALCHRSKAHWGYDKRFMEFSRDALTVDPERIAGGWVLVAELDGVPAGVAAIGPDGDGFEIDQFFTDPDMMGKGVGARLFVALLDLARARGIERLSILSDPNAAGFYERMGARHVGSAPSDAVPGRTLPLLEIVVPPSNASI
ncbi:GNAT family N-acetyltransferase [Nitratireductor sp. XY-223]|uniref:GNAT family N-acetyltransferase n=1 Tax=Nitratireductor sp. XY-223 TaxID=2561926 RepID=UPI0010AACE0B|nr:GNAT family N-acetyltransferase [Nitratireductor sp. XY-223]